MNPSPPRHTTTFALLILLGVILCGFGWLARYAPCFGTEGVSTFISPANSLAVVVTLQTAPPADGSLSLEQLFISFAKCYRVDLRTGSICELGNTSRYSPLIYLDEPPDTVRQIRIHQVARQDDPGPVNWSQDCNVNWQVYDVASGRLLKSVPTMINVNDMSFLIDDSIKVVKEENHFGVLDFSEREPTERHVPTDNPHFGVWNLEGTRHFLVGTAKPGASRPLELFHLNKENRVERIKRLDDASVVATIQSATTVYRDWFVTVDSQSAELQIRSLADGETTKRWKLPAKHLGSDWTVEGRYVLAHNIGTLFVYDWWDDGAPISVDSRDRYPCFRNDVFSFNIPGGRSFLDLKTGELIGTLPERDEPGYYDARIAIFSSQEWGLTIRQYDLKTGRIEHILRPYRWVLPALGVLSLSICVWSVFWAGHTATLNRPAWIDLALIAGTSLSLLAFRAAVAGATIDSDRVVYQLAQGIYIAALALSLFWLFFGPQRLAVAILWPLLLTALLALILSLLFRFRLSVAWSGFATTMFPVAVLTPPLACIRLLGLQLGRPTQGASQIPDAIQTISDSSRKETLGVRRTRMGIRDLFLVTLVVSICLGAIRLMDAGMHLNFNSGSITLPILSWTGLVLLVTTGMLSPWRWPAIILTAAAPILSMLVIASPLAQFVTGNTEDVPRWTEWSPILRVLLTSTVALTLLLLPMRSRGWRWRRAKPPQAAKDLRASNPAGESTVLSLPPAR